jgi:hypothetical protein
MEQHGVTRIGDLVQDRLLGEAALRIAAGQQGPGTWLLATTLAHPSLQDEGLVRACQDYAEAVAVRDAIGADGDLWAHYYPGMEQGPGQADAARAVAERYVAEAFAFLAGGERR